MKRKSPCFFANAGKTRKQSFFFKAFPPALTQEEEDYKQRPLINQKK